MASLPAGIEVAGPAAATCFTTCTRSTTPCPSRLLGDGRGPPRRATIARHLHTLQKLESAGATRSARRCRRYGADGAAPSVTGGSRSPLLHQPIYHDEIEGADRGGADALIDELRRFAAGRIVSRSAGSPTTVVPVWQSPAPCTRDALRSGERALMTPHHDVGDGGAGDRRHEARPTGRIRMSRVRRAGQRASRARIRQGRCPLGGSRCGGRSRTPRGGLYAESCRSRRTTTAASVYDIHLSVALARATSSRADQTAERRAEQCTATSSRPATRACSMVEQAGSTTPRSSERALKTAGRAAQRA